MLRLQTALLQRSVGGSMTERQLNHFDVWSGLVIGLPLVLFLIAVFVKGITHDLL